MTGIETKTGGAQMIKSLPQRVMIRHDNRVDTYLLALGALCVELARAPQLLPVFLRLIAMAPRTVAELQRRRAA